MLHNLLDYFKSTDHFIHLQINFLKQDYIYQLSPESYSIKNILRKDEFYIEKEFVIPDPNDQYSYLTEYKKELFYKDYLPTVISKIAEDYLGDFFNKIREDHIEDQKNRRKYLSEEKNSVNQIFENLDQFNFIGVGLVNELKIQIIEIEKVLKSPVLFNDKYIKIDKLTLTGWKEQDLLLFFTFLKEQKVISPKVTDADLGMFLERNFCVEKDDVVTELDKLNKSLSFFASGNKKTYKAEVRLKRLFDKFNINSSD